MSQKKEIILAIIGIILVGVIILFIWAIQHKKVTPFAGTIHSAGLSFSPAVGEVYNNQQFTIDILLDAQDLQSSGVEIVINYDPEIIDIVDQNPDVDGIQISEGNLFPIVFENLADPETKTIRFSTAKGDGPPIIINAPRVLASITFIAKRAGNPIELNFDFNKGKTNDCNVYQSTADVEQDVLFGVNNGYYTTR